MEVKFKNKVTSIFVLIISLITFLIVLLASDKYKVKLLETDYGGESFWLFYYDLDNDGISEKLEFHTYPGLRTGLLTYKNNKILNQRNVEGVYVHPNFSLPILKDFDCDNSVEVFFFTQRIDSLFLNCIDPINDITEFSDKFVCSTPGYNGDYIFPIGKHLFINTIGDNRSELYFVINAGFAKYPRNIFAYLPQSDTIVRSPESCNIINDFNIIDLDSDNVPEIFGGSWAPGNCDFDHPYTDQFGWLMVFTPELDFSFPPIRMDKHPCVTSCIPYTKDGESCILVYHLYMGTEDIRDFLAVIDQNGNIVKRREILEKDEIGPASLFFSMETDSGARLIDYEGNIFSIDKNLDLKFEKSIGGTYTSSKVLIDVDNDGSEEIIYWSEIRELLQIFREGFVHPVSLTVPQGGGNWFFSINYTERGNSEFVISSDKQIQHFSYGISDIYRLWYLYLIAIISGAGFIAYVFSLIKNYRILKEKDKKNRLIKLQLSSINNQLDPHFTFNLIESFSNLITEQDTEKAEYILNKYSGLLKRTVLNSEKVSISLREELEFIESYLDLEKLRAGNGFDYKIIMNDKVDNNTEIPKMLIHIFVENAVKHGLKHLKEGKGLIEIRIAKSGPGICLEIIDNGVGRKRAKEIGSFSTGKGLKIIDEIISMNQAIGGRKIKYYIEDIFWGAEAGGTKVIIDIL